MKRLFKTIFVVFLVGAPCFANEPESEQKESETYDYIPFTVGPHAFTNFHSVFITADEPGSKNFSLSQFSNDMLTPWAPEMVKQNYQEDQKNPFYNKKISHLELRGTLPLVVAADCPHDVHCVINRGSEKNPMQILSAEEINDASGNPGGIVGLSLSKTNTGAKNSIHYVLAAVKPERGAWGQQGSGIALLKFDQEEREVENIEKSEKDTKDKKIVNQIYFNILDAQNGKEKGNKAYPLDVCLPSYVSMKQVEKVDLYWDHDFKRLYVPLQIKTDSTSRPDQGACALLIGTLCDDQLSLSPIVCLDIFDASADGIIGAAGPNKSVSLKKVRVMHTSTGLPYLIVLGGSGSQDEAAIKVAALPLTNKDAVISDKELLDDPEYGVIARKNDVPTVQFLNGLYGRFRRRLLQEPTKTKEDFYSYHDRAVNVGAQASLPNAITDIVVLKDCVYAFVHEDGNGLQAGVFYSQAIFNQHGRIASWTPWSRAAGSCSDAIDMLIEPNKSKISFLESNPPKIRNVEWIHERPEDSRSQTLADILRDEFPQGSGGAQGLFDFDAKTPGLSGQEKTSLLIATGNKKVLLAQTGFENDQGIFIPNDDFSMVNCSDGTLRNKAEEEFSVLSLSGGVFDELGPLSCAEVVHDGIQAWIFVAGINGLAVLSDENGNGWPITQGVGKKFSGLSSSFSFKKFGNYSNVKKLVHDGNVLYILTRDRLERLFSFENHVDSTVLATSDQLQAKFTDVLISGPCALLGTTDGLFRVGNGCDIQKEMSQDAVLWKRIKIPSASSSINSLAAVCPSGKETGFAYDGQVYVLSGSINSNESFVNRFFVRDVQKTGVTDNTICLIADYGVRDHVSNFIAFGGYRNNFFSDGLFHVSTRGGGSPMIHALPAFIGGKLMMESRGLSISLPWTSNPCVRPIVKNSADGSWLVAGDFGICTYQ